MFTNLKPKVAALIKAECANYDALTGLCLPLDCPCVQLNSLVSLQQEGYLSCNHFRGAVLPRDMGLLALVASRSRNGFGNLMEKACSVCAKAFFPTSGRQKYCKACACLMRRKNEARRMREYRMEKAG